MAVVFGGRSTEHAVSCVSAGSVLARHRPRRATTSCRSASPARAAGCSPPTSRRSWRSPAASCPRSTTPAPRSCSPATRPTAGLAVHEPGAGAPGARRGRRRLAAAARPVRRGRHDPGPARAGRRPLRRLGGLRLGRRDGQGPHEGAARGRRAARSGRTPSSPPRAWATDKAARPRDRRRRWATRSSSSRPGPARASASPRCTTPAELDDAIEAARAHDPRVVVEAMRRRAARSSAACSRASTAAARGQRPGRGRRRRRPRVLRLRGQVPARRGHRARRARRPARRRGRRGQRRWRCGRSRRWPARAWRGSTSSSAATARSSSTRSTRCPGFTPVSMFPLMWAASGIDYPALVDRLVQTALRRPTGLRAEPAFSRAAIAVGSAHRATGRGRGRPAERVRLGPRRRPTAAPRTST